MTEETQNNNGDATTRSDLDRLPDAVLVVDDEGTVLSWPPKAEALFGWTREEAEGRHVGDTIQPAHFRSSFAERLKIAAENPDSPLRTWMYGDARCRDGRTIAVDLLVLPFRQNGRQLFHTLFHPAPEKLHRADSIHFEAALFELARTSDKSLSESLARISRVAAHTLSVARVGIWFFTDDDTAIEQHVLYELSSDRSSVQKLKQYAADYPAYFTALRERRVLPVVDGCSDPHMSEFCASYLRPLGITSLLDVPIWSAGRMVGIVCHEHVGPARVWSEEEITFGAAVADMVTVALEAEERRKAEEEARLRAAQLEAITENMLDGVTAVDSEGRVQFANRAAREFYSLQLKPGDDMRAILSSSQPTAEGKPIDVDEMPLFKGLRGISVIDQIVTVKDHPTGKVRVTRLSAGPIRDSNGNITGALVVGRDITDHVDLERLKDQFLRVAAHELKTPMSVIKGYAQVINRLAERNEPLPKEVAASLVRGSERMSAMVGDLLHALKAQQGLFAMPLEVSEFRLDEAVAQLVADLTTTTTRHRLETAGLAPVIVRGDRRRVQQAVSNLLENAIKYSPAGGTITTGVSRTDGEAEVWVRDEGVGIPREQQQRLFQLFYRAHTDTPHDAGGLGIGLFLVKAIVEEHGGSVSFTSEPGRGSTFRFRLPLAS